MSPLVHKDHDPEHDGNGNNHHQKIGHVAILPDQIATNRNCAAALCHRGSRGLAFHFFASHPTRFRVRRQDIADGRHFYLRRPRRALASITSAMPENGIRRSRNASTATSSAALNAHGYAPILRMASLCQAQARKPARRNLFEVEAAQLSPNPTLLHWMRPAQGRLAHIGWACAYPLGRVAPKWTHPHIRPWNESWTADG